jgi:hypothetical protein
MSDTTPASVPFAPAPMRTPLISLLPADVDIRNEWDAKQPNVLHRSGFCLELRHRTIARRTTDGYPIREGPQILTLRRNSDGGGTEAYQIKDVDALITAIRQDLAPDAALPHTLVVTPEVATFLVDHEAFLGIGRRFMITAFDESRARRDPVTGQVLWFVGLTAFHV